MDLDALVMPLRSPFVVLVFSFVVLWLSARVGASYVRRGQLEDEVHKDFDFVLSASLSLLALIIGFNLLVGVTRFDQRKQGEIAEANAIGTEYARADLLPSADAAKVRTLLKTYVGQRLAWYTTRDDKAIAEIDARTAKLQAELWGAVVAAAAAQPNPITALAVTGMNDVLNSQVDTQGAWWNRIPVGAWGLMMSLAVCCNLMIGYGVRKLESVGILLFILPAVVSVSFFLIADIDSPRRGMIRVPPQNLQSLAESLRAP